MPLGILLAAAWLEMLTPAEIAGEVERSLDFLETDWRDVPARQRSMRAVFDHSWSLLGEREREILAGLSVFRGGFARGAAERVVGASLRELMGMVSRSLVHRTADGRYEVHELLRQYAAEKLAAVQKLEKETRDRHCAFFSAALERWDEKIKGPQQLAALSDLEADLGNARAAWDWAAEQEDVARLDQAMDGLCRFYEWRGRYEEGEAACRAAAEALGAQIDVAYPSLADGGLCLQAKATAWRGAFHRALIHIEQAKGFLGESLVLLETLASSGQDVRQERAFALWQMGYTLCDLDDQDAKRQYKHSLALYRTLGDRWGTATVLYHLSDLLAMANALDEAEELIREGLSIQQDLGDHRGAASSVRVLGLIAVSTGRLEESKRLTQQSVAAFRAAGDLPHAAEALLNVAFALVCLGRLAEARSRFEESVSLYRDLGFTGSAGGSALMMLGWAELLLGRYNEARARAQEALALAQERGFDPTITLSLAMLIGVAIATGDYAQAELLLQQDLSSLEGTSWYLWTLAPLAGAARGLGQPDRAQQYLCTALRGASETKGFLTSLDALTTIALLLVDRGEVERAVELYALASRYPYVANAQWFEDVVGRHIAAAAATLPPDVVAAAQERGRGRDLWETVEELLVELEQWEGHGRRLVALGDRQPFPQHRRRMQQVEVQPGPRHRRQLAPPPVVRRIVASPVAGAGLG